MGAVRPDSLIMMKCLALFALLGCALARPQVPVVYAGHPVGGVYGLPVYPYAHAAHAALHSGVVYPLAAPYVHDATGDIADDASPDAEAYVHVADDASPDAEAYVHVADVASPNAPAYVHDPAGDV